MHSKIFCEEMVNLKVWDYKDGVFFQVEVETQPLEFTKEGELILKKIYLHMMNDIIFKNNIFSEEEYNKMKKSINELTR